MIPTLLLLAQASRNVTPTAAPSSPDLAARALAFARALAEDRYGSPISKALGDGQPRRFPLRDLRGQQAYGIGDRIVWVGPFSGWVTIAHGGDDHGLERSRPKTDRQGRPGLYPVERRVSDDEAKKLLQRYYAATGSPYGIEISGFQKEAGDNGDDLGLNFVPVYRGVPYQDVYGGYMDIDRETGRLDYLLIVNEPPLPPASVVPKVAADDAHLTALQAAARAGIPVRDFPNPHAELTIAALDRMPDPQATYAFTPIDRADAAARQGRLVYDVRLKGVQRGPLVLYTALVDALDGRLLQVRRQSLDALGSTDGPKTPLFAPPADVRPWRVSEGDAPWSAPAFATLVPASSDGFAPARKLLLTDGKVAFQAGVDPATGRIGLDGLDGKTQVYQPGPALADLLKRRTKG